MLHRFLTAVSLGIAVSAQTVDWPGYLGGPEASHYSALTQINRGNVKDLKVAWVYHSEDKRSQGEIQCNPLVMDGVLYGTSPKRKLFALDAATGKELWSFRPEGGAQQGINRGVAYWSKEHEKRILYTAANFLYAVNASNGKLIVSFGDAGKVDLKKGLGRDASDLYVSGNTPGVVFEDLYVVGMRVNEALPAAPGHIRAYNIRTGDIAWTFHTIPQPGEFGYDTWPAGAHEYTGAANSWAGMSVDRERGIVYVPTGSSAFDFYGADRHGQNLFANCLLALNARTGERIWHFQMVHHDLWDRDLPAPPNLLTVTRDGKRIDAVAQITKSAHVFVFNRETGEPLFPIEERPVPPSDLEGESAWPTQPFPTLPPPFSRQRFNEDDVTNISPESHATVLDRLKRARSDGQFVPPSREGTIILPGFDGGGEWGGAAVDPNSGIMYVNGSEMPWILQMVDIGTDTGGAARQGKRLYAQHCLFCHGVDMKGDPLKQFPALAGIAQRLPRKDAEAVVLNGRALMPSFKHLGARDIEAVLDHIYASDAAQGAAKDMPTGKPHYVNTGYIRFLDPEGYPAIKPPWGTLNAIDLNKGEILWKVTLGDTPALRERGLPQTGTENYGGPVLTAGGLLFIGATKDEMFRAFDKDNGILLWQAQLPAGGYATPATFMAGGRQYVVITAGGGKIGTKAGDAYVAFTLPE